MKVGRNAPCPCGSGKKYKRCCLVKEYRETLSPAEEYKTALSKVFEKATQFAGKHFRDEMEKAMEDFASPGEEDDLDETALLSFANYFLLDYLLSDGGTIFDRFVEKRGGKLSSLEQKMLSPLQESHISLYEVQSVEQGKGFRVKEVFTDEEHWVPERRPTETLIIWTLLATRIIRLDDVSLILGSAIPFPPIEKPRMIEAINKASRGRLFRRPISMNAFFRKHGEFFFQYHLQRQRELSHPVLMTMEGERMVLADLHYKVLDFEKALKALKGIEEFTLRESTEKEWVFDWVVPHDKGPIETIVRATITFTPAKMIVRCKSRERADKVKKIVDGCLKGLVKHQADKIQDPCQALEEYERRRPVEPLDEVPNEVQNQLISEMLERHYSQWVDEPLPVLKNYTPRQAVKDPKLFPLLESLLKDIEHQNELDKREGRAVYEVDRLRRELGLC